jgi:DNA-binding response OmpR family regulator
MLTDQKPYKVLVLDDDPDIGLMIRMMLEFKGYDVTVAERAEVARGILKDKKPDLLIMDMLLSGENGTDICTELKNDSATSDLPVVMISAHPNAKQLCMEAGADDFLAKPFDMHDLFTRIQGIIDAA